MSAPDEARATVGGSAASGAAEPRAGVPDAIAPKPFPRRFHQASWDEPVIFELSTPGARGVLLPPLEPA
ncbi:MAG: hypothetical protein M0Z49_12105, partial [Chloroflexi bacterium]|nr:hypothetical protein [Chloroflexota bacterium]